MTDNTFQGFEDLHDLGPETGKAKVLTEVTLIVEDCPKCRGTGQWRTGYRCFKCKGKGKLSFKTTAEQRSKGRKSAAKSKAKKADENEASWTEYLDSRKAIHDWLKAGVISGNSFAQSLSMSGKQYGCLTDGQEAAVLKAIARDDEGAEGFKAWCENHEGVLQWLESETAAGNEFAGSLLSKGKRFGSLSDGQLACVEKSLGEQYSTELAGSELDISSLKGYYAVPDGDTRLKLCVRRPGKNSRWFGWTFVDDGAGYGRRKTYGKQGPDEMYKGGVQDSLRAILAAPRDAMIAYGRLTGTCGMCGRLLEDEQSVAAGIGPICAAK